MKLTKKEIARRLHRQRIEGLATGITGIVMQHTLRDDLTGAYVRSLCRALNRFKSGAEWKRLPPEAQRAMVEMIVCLEQVDIELLRREYGIGAPSTT